MWCWGERLGVGESRGEVMEIGDGDVLWIC